ncbi:alpha/beta fold hydrolase [Lactiplantibacillus paraplantarum]|uniref:alpha/beta fold hydrolase n=1 Tax=Lactiplantibacillus paraplantarum TaxID=60520 RepID=UPI003DA3ACA6
MKQSYIDVPTKLITTSEGVQYAYRDMDEHAGIPIVALNHLSANLDNWDPAIIDGLAADWRVITFDYQGVGQSDGQVPTSIKMMATNTMRFIEALKLEKVILFGFSMGGMVVQELLVMAPQLVESVILAGTGPRGGTGIEAVTRVSDQALIRSILSLRDVKATLFFTNTPNGQQAASAFLTRLKLRQQSRDRRISWWAYRRQLRAIRQWGLDSRLDLINVKQPVLIINGDHDIMVPTEPNTADLHHELINSRMIIYPDAGHGSIAQYHETFVKSALAFLNENG